MNISNIVSSISNNIKMNNKETSKNTGVSFKGIYIENSVDIGNAKEGTYPPRFLKKDALLLNKIASKYPNQDCFIRKGYAGRPRLEYREKPPEVMVFDADLAKRYKMIVNSIDKEYPSVPLIIHPNSDLNAIIGVPSYISTNPSLPFTVQVGFELHKKLIAQKMKIMDVIGKTDYVTLGGESVIEKAHKAIAEIEVAVVRFLVESAYDALTDKASGSQIYSSGIPKIQTVLDADRKFDLTTSVSEQEKVRKKAELEEEKEKQSKSIGQKLEDVDICDVAMKYYPNMEENKVRIENITAYMRQQGITLDDSEDLTI